jgi:outer membrane receptor protein involved in Fe transport
VNDPQGSSILQQVAAPGTNTLILNGETLESYGVEFEATWAVTDSFTLQGIYGWQDVKNKSSTQSCLDVVFNANGFPGNPVDNPEIDFNDPASIAANAVTFEESDGFLATEWNYAISAIYDRDIGPGRFTANLTAKVTDDVQIASLVGVPIIEEGYTLWDARIAYAWNLGNGDILMFEVFGKNLNDEEYREQELPLGIGGGFRGWGPPRQIAAALTWTH